MSCFRPSVRVFVLILLRVSVFLCLSSFCVVLRFCMSRRSDSSCSLFVIVLSWGCSSCVVVALPVITFSSLSLKPAAVVCLFLALGLVVLGLDPGVFGKCVWCVRPS